MKKRIINYFMKIIKENNNYSNIKLEEIQYGLEGLYLQITKMIVLIIIASVLNIFNEFFIFLGIYAIIRCSSFGLHATKSLICLISSIMIFIGFPFISNLIILSTYFKLVLGIILIVLIYKNAPADTLKRPIINTKRRMFYKYISTFIAIIYVYLSVLIKNDFLSNCLIYSLLLQCFMISPRIYKLFRLPYNNYLKYSF